MLRRLWGGSAEPEALPEVRAVFEALPLPALLRDEGHRVLYANPVLAAALGVSAEQLRGCDWFERFLAPEQRASSRAAFEKQQEAGTGYREERELVLPSGEERAFSWSHALLRDAAGALAGVATVGEDITDRKRVEDKLLHSAFYDGLTGLPNRALFMDRLGGCMARAKRRPAYRFAAVFLDLDRFKTVNEGLGHTMGDQLLVEVGRRLLQCLRPGDSVARLAGDEFAILLDDLTDATVPGRVAARIQQCLRTPFDLAGREVFATASLGIALNKARYEGPDDFVRDGATALHHAKTQGRAQHQVFETGMHTRAMVLLQIENDLHRAVEREELSVHYQPIVSMATGRVAAFEALVRWDRGERAPVPTLDFVRIAEETGLIVPLGAFVLREACRQLRTWQRELGDGNSLGMSVNLSARQFVQADLVEQVGRTVEEAAVAPGSLTLEVTESILMQDPEGAAGMLAALREKSVHVCIDDFGTGYSSLSYLLRLPAQTLKIDRSFVSGLSDGRQQTEMVKTIILLARNLDMGVVAEGVETEDQMARLRGLGCDFAQGYLLSRPLDAAAASRLLHERAR